MNIRWQLGDVEMNEQNVNLERTISVRGGPLRPGGHVFVTRCGLLELVNGEKVKPKKMATNLIDRET